MIYTMALGMIQMVLPAITKTIDRKESRNEQFRKLYDFYTTYSKQSRISRYRARFCWLWIILIITGNIHVFIRLQISDSSKVQLNYLSFIRTRIN